VHVDARRLELEERCVQSRQAVVVMVCHRTLPFGSRSQPDRHSGSIGAWPASGIVPLLASRALRTGGFAL
jgi:hypothetical protein